MNTLINYVLRYRTHTTTQQMMIQSLWSSWYPTVTLTTLLYVLALALSSLPTSPWPPGTMHSCILEDPVFISLATLQPRMCTLSLSCPLNVRPQPGHATITCSSYACLAIAFLSSTDASGQPGTGRVGAVVASRNQFRQSSVYSLKRS